MMRHEISRRRLIRLAAVIVAVVLLTTGARADQNMQVTPLARDGRLLVTFRLSDAFNDDIRTAIHSGLTITFVYDIELRRGTSLWLDRTLAQATVMATVRLTGTRNSADTTPVAIVIPADGPSLGIAPSGRCTWMSARE